MSVWVLWEADVKIELDVKEIYWQGRGCLRSIKGKGTGVDGKRLQTTMWLWGLWEERGKGRKTFSLLHGLEKGSAQPVEMMPIGRTLWWAGGEGHGYPGLAWSLAEHSPGERSLTMSSGVRWGESKGQAGGHEPTLLLTAGSPTRRCEQGIPFQPLSHTTTAPSFMIPKLFVISPLSAGLGEQKSRDPERQRAKETESEKL